MNQNTGDCHIQIHKVEQVIDIQSYLGLNVINWKQT
jgi:hypothetical protein